MRVEESKREPLEERSFYPFYRERLRRIVERLRKEYREMKILQGSVWGQIGDALYGVFHMAAARTLIAELHACKNGGLLSGNTAGEEFQSYGRLLEKQEYVDLILHGYPGLAGYLESLEELQLAFWKEFLGRLQQDWGQIRKALQMDEEERVEFVERGSLDFHCGGKSVVMVCTDRGKRFFYKSHSLDNEIFWQELLSAIHRDLGMEEFHYAVLEKGDYGWAQEVTCQECVDQKAVMAFYERMGILGAAAYVLGMGDLHYENLIAHGEFPVIVDTETLFGQTGPLYRWKEKPDAFYSALDTALFPGGAADCQTAGMTGGAGRGYVERIPVIQKDKTSEICVTYGKVRLLKGKNRAIYQGMAVGWEGYEREIIGGFERAYRWFLEHRDAVLGKISSRKGTLRGRFVSGHTQLFALGISASTHPTLMKESFGRCSYFRTLCKDRTLGKWEAQAMLLGDIPCFYRELTGRSLYCGAQVAQNDFFGDSVINWLRERMRHLSMEDCTLQKQTIAYSCMVFGGRSGKIKNVPDSKIHNRPDGYPKGIVYAKRIADCILENAVAQGDSIFWLGIEGEGKNIKIKPVDLYFYGGIAGMAVFFRKMHRVCGLYGEVCGKLEKMLFSYTDRIGRGEICPATEYPGMYCGEGSVVYVYQLLYKISGKTVYKKYAGKHARILLRCVRQEAPFDLLYGNAGAVLVFCQQYADTGDAMYLQMAQTALWYLENERVESEQGVTWFGKEEGNPVCSVAHGNSGVLLAYARVQSLDDSADYRERMKQIIKYEDQFYGDVYGNWADLRKSEKEQWNTYAWCNGGVGVAAARAQAALWNDKIPELLCGLEKGRRVLANCPAGEKCACVMGISEIILP